MFSIITHADSVEQIPSTLTNLNLNAIGSPIQLTPKKMDTAVEGLYISITVSLVNGATAITSGTVGNFINEIKIMQGTKTLLSITSMKQLQDFYHIKTGL